MINEKESDVPHAHDLMFKSAMTDLRIARDVLSHYLPERIKQKICLDTLQLENGSFIDPELKALHTDILYSVDVIDSLTGERAYIYAHIEHQSAGDPLISFRMLKYSVRIIERHLKNTGSKTLPVIIPMVIYNGEKVFSDSLSVFGLFDEYKAFAQEYMFNQFHLIDLNTIPDEEIRQRQWSCLMEMMLKHIHSRDLMSLLETMTQDFQRFAQEKADDHILSVLKYIIEKSSIKDRQKFLTWVTKNLPPKLEKEAMTLAEQWKSEGVQIGMEQGMTLAKQWKNEGIQIGMEQGMTLAKQWKNEGIQIGMEQGMTLAKQWKNEGIQIGTLQGERMLLKKLLARRFGLVPSAYLEKVEHANAKSLLELGDKIIEAKNLDEIFEDYPQG